VARKTFISYKYSEAWGLRDKIIAALGDDATYYQGETSDSPDLSDVTTETIKKNLADMMYDTTVTIVIISPKMRMSKWIDWEIEYSLKEITRKGRTSKTNGIVGVIQKVNGSYNWFVSIRKIENGCTVRNYAENILHDIIRKNRYNRKNPKYGCDHLRVYHPLHDSYISLIDEDDFLRNPHSYIENAYEKSEAADEFILTKQR